MVQHESFYLANGLKVIVHEDHKAPLAVVNLLYKVGARDEDPEKQDLPIFRAPNVWRL